MVSVWEKTTTNVGAIFNYLHFKENFQFAVCQSQLPFQHATFYFHFTRTLTIRFTVSDTQKEYYSFLIGLSLRSNITGTIPWLQSCDQNWLRLDCFPDGKVCNRKYIFFFVHCSFSAQNISELAHGKLKHCTCIHWMAFKSKLFTWTKKSQQS